MSITGEWAIVGNAGETRRWSVVPGRYHLGDINCLLLITYSAFRVIVGGDDDHRAHADFKGIGGGDDRHRASSRVMPAE